MRYKGGKNGKKNNKRKYKTLVRENYCSRLIGMSRVGIIRERRRKKIRKNTKSPRSRYKRSGDYYITPTGTHFYLIKKETFAN